MKPLQAIEKKDIELEYWRNLFKQETSEEEMQLHYSKLKERTTEMGY